MEIIITINLENDSFSHSGELEISRLLNEINQKIVSGQKDFYVRDTNGNRVGAVSIKGN